ncbi:MAG: DNA-3-methyladenine glycosylase I [Actinomyces sp.]|nr:MAG: DNA-3-methyladenine glycosylase I [Actinomyces sp.]
MSAGLVVGADGVARCAWAGSAPDYVAYHDLEWGRPVVDDRRLFEKICLEGFQSGLSWLTILRKRERFREVFAGFDPAVVATYGPDDVDRLLADPGIIRHRGKIEATIHNAARALELVEEAGSLAAFFWSHEPAPRRRRSADDPPPPSTPGSRRLARELKARGWRFVGPTTLYAFMQAMGLVNDHLVGCAAGEACEAERSELERPAS